MLLEIERNLFVGGLPHQRPNEEVSNQADEGEAEHDAERNDRAGRESPRFQP
jgi:hypothetical protein